MPRFRLRYQATDFEVRPGDFAIGRNSDCGLTLNDSRVSRRHAIIRVGEEKATIEDLGSRNGVTVNGSRIDGQRELQHLDRITIGAQEMVWLDQNAIARTVAPRATTRFQICPQCGNPTDPQSESVCAHCGAPLDPAATVSGARTMELDAGPEDETQRGLVVIASIAEKAIGLGKVQEAERMLAGPLDRMLLTASQGRSVAEEELERACDLALRLAEGGDAKRWLDWVFRIHTAVGRLMSERLIGQLHEVVRKARYSDPRALRAYLQVYSNQSSLSAPQRFRLRRLESLERVITA